MSELNIFSDSNKPMLETPVLIQVNGEILLGVYQLCSTEYIDEWFEEVNGVGPDFIDIYSVEAWCYLPSPMEFI